MALPPFKVLLLFAASCVASSEVDDVSVAHVYANAGSNVSLPCLPQSLRSDSYGYTPPVDDNSVLVWIREGKALQHSRVEPNGILSLTRITSADAGLYVCQVEQSYGYSDTTVTRIAQVELHVKTTPPAPVNLAVYPSSVLALVTWKLNSTGGYPVKSITVVYQEVLDDWGNPAWHRTYPEELEPTTTQLEIYKLQPNTTYRFRVWATNKLGPGDYAEAIATTREIISTAAVHGGYLLAAAEGQFQAYPWILSLGILVGSVGFTVVVLVFLLVQNQRACSRRRTYESSEDMELVTNIILNPGFPDNENSFNANEGLNDRQSLLCSRKSNPRPVRL